MKYLIYLVFGICGLVVGYILFNGNSTNKNLATSEECKLIFLNPLRCTADQFVPKVEYSGLQHELNIKISEAKRQDIITDSAIYFRDLEGGPSVLFNPNEKFWPASLMKTPLMIAYFKKAESDPTILNKKLIYHKDLDTTTQEITREETLKDKASYSVTELIERMIIKSDNNAGRLLLENIGRADFDDLEVLSDLGITYPVKPVDNLITVKEYASMFRILYNGSYLSPEYSNKALAILIKTTFNKGLIAKLPKNVKVAHKYGELDLENQKGISQFHDCGVVYHPEAPYLICIMTRGMDVEKLYNFVADMSLQIYNEVSEKN